MNTLLQRRATPLQLQAVLCAGLLLTAPGFAARAQVPASPPEEKASLLEDPFRLGAILQDTNGDQIADMVCGHVIVSASPSAAENAAAANLAARLGYETSALTLPLGIQSSPRPAAGCPSAASNF